MGSGKTTVGKNLARQLNIPFIDTDKLIEAEQNKTIPEIFKEYGEPYFRQLEKNALISLPQEAVVVSTGGGIITTPECISIMKSTGYVIFLHLPLRHLLGRLKKDSTRPLLQTQNPKKTILDLYAKREPLYKSAAHLTLSTGDMSVPQIREAIIKLIFTIKKNK